jgi:hypothetical protein
MLGGAAALPPLTVAESSALAALLCAAGLADTARDSRAALEAGGATAAFSLLGPESMQRVFLHAERGSTMSAARVSALRCYERYAGAPDAAYPITLERAGGYLAHYVIQRGLSSGSLDTALSNLKAGAVACGVWAVAGDDSKVLLHGKGVLQKLVPAPASLATVVPAAALHMAMSDGPAAGGVRSPAVVQQDAILALGLSFQLRGNEYPKLDVGDVHLCVNEDVLIAGVHRTKTKKDSHDRELRATGHPGREWSALCPIAAFRRLQPLLGPPGTPLFRRPNADGSLSGTRLSPTGITAIVRAALERSGMARGVATRIRANWGRKAGYSAQMFVFGMRVDAVELSGGRKAQSSSAGQKAYRFNSADRIDPQMLAAKVGAETAGNDGCCAGRV